jgi:hypothetical protein
MYISCTVTFLLFYDLLLHLRPTIRLTGKVYICVFTVRYYTYNQVYIIWNYPFQNIYTCSVCMYISCHITCKIIMRCITLLLRGTFPCVRCTKRFPCKLRKPKPNALQYANRSTTLGKRCILYDITY